MTLALALSVGRAPIGAAANEPGDRSPSALRLEPLVVTRHSVRITVDPRVELMSIVQYLSSQYREKLPFLMTSDVSPYQQAVLARFAAHASHPVVGRFDEIALKPGGFNYSFPPYAMLYVDAGLRLRPDLALDGYLVQRAGGRESLEQLLELLAEFCETTACEEFFADHEDYYRGLLEEVEEKIAHRNYVEDIERFYGTRQASYAVVLVSLYGGVGFGPHVDTTEGQRHVFNIMGPRGLEGGEPYFGDQGYYDYIQRHEFSHPFVNPLSTKHADAVASLSHVFDSLPESAKRVCGEWEECVNENIVRAVTTHLAFNDGPEAGRAALKRETDRGAVFVPALLDLVRDYDDNRDRYPTFGSFYEELLTAFRPIEDSQ